MPNVLIIDDDKIINAMLHQRLESKGYTAACAYTIAEGISCADDNDFDVVLLDVKLPDGNGLDYLTKFANMHSTPEIIIMTGEGDPDGAAKAIKSGAWSYLEKPHVIRDIFLPLTRALEFREQKKTISTAKVLLKREKIIGESKAINTCLEQLANASTSDASMLLTGETGTGKELFARALHDNSNRAGQPFVIVDCASLPETLIESTLFGHIKGAFTGADRAEEGLIQLADRGTLFLDEVGELPFDIQKKFLRVIQEGSYRPVGSKTEHYSNFRVIAATNRNLEQMSQIGSGMFRADLLYRLRSFHIHLPPLRERKEDIQILARHIVTKICTRLQIEQKALSSDFISHLKSHCWLGNVRELYQFLEEVTARAYQFPVLFSYHLPDHIRISQAQDNLQPKPAEPNTITAPQPLSWKDYKLTMEKDYLSHLMTYTENNIESACNISGMSRARVYQLLKKQGMKLSKK